MPLLSGSILIVDDNPLNRLLIKQVVSSMGLSTEEAENGELALELLKIEKFDLVLLDITMQGMGGIEVLEAIRSMRHHKDLPVVMMSAADDLNTIKKCLNMGAVDYLTKPFDIKLVQSRIFYALKTATRSLESSALPIKEMHSRILVVDDEPLNLQLIRHSLADKGYDLQLMESPAEALTALSNADYDLIMLDIKMPEMDGIQLLEAIKKNESIKNIPVLMLSALDDFKTIKKCLEKGAIDYVSKPFKKPMLMARVESCLAASPANS